MPSTVVIASHAKNDSTTGNRRCHKPSANKTGERLMPQRSIITKYQHRAGQAGAGRRPGLVGARMGGARRGAGRKRPSPGRRPCPAVGPERRAKRVRPGRGGAWGLLERAWAAPAGAPAASDQARGVALARPSARDDVGNRFSQVSRCCCKSDRGRRRPPRQHRAGCLRQPRSRPRWRYADSSPSRTRARGRACAWGRGP